MHEKSKASLNVYQHRDTCGKVIELPVGKVVCVGRNYMDHIAEMSNQVSDVPLLFMKPSTAIVSMQSPLIIPTEQGECHNELEVALLIGKKVSKLNIEEVGAAVCGIGLGLDLTLRDEQTRLKTAGQPWERAKSFDGSCPLSSFLHIDAIDESDHYTFSLTINNRLVQKGDTRLMLTPMMKLISEISQHFTLLPGDIVLTGTPKGVGPLNVGDSLVAVLDGHLQVSTRVIN